MTSSTACRSSSPLLRVVHGLVLLGWLLSSNGLAPAFTLVAAVLDQGHRVSVESWSKGEVHVVLSHPSGEAKGGVHVHGVLTKLVMIFAQRTEGLEADHVLAFRSMEDLGRPSKRDVVRVAADMPVQPVHYVLVKLLPVMDRRECVVHCPKVPVWWSPGVELKAGKTLMQC